VPAGDRRLLLIEAKASKTVTPRMGSPMLRLERLASGYTVRSLVVHQGRPGLSEPAALVPGVRSIADDKLDEALETALGRRTR